MPPRWRKAVGLLALLMGLLLYAGAVVALADLIPDHWLVDLVFFTIAGILWVFPAARLIRWMQALDP